jgi:hypothetical protein
VQTLKKFLDGKVDIIKRAMLLTEALDLAGPVIDDTGCWYDKEEDIFYMVVVLDDNTAITFAY